MHRILVSAWARRIRGGAKCRTRRTINDVGGGGGEGRKEGRKARRYRRGGGNPAGFNHRPTRRRGSPSAFYPLHAPPPSPTPSFGGGFEASLLREAAAGRVRGTGREGPRGLARGASDRRRYADRAYLELADASQSIYLAKAPLDRCPGPTPPRYLPPAREGGGRGTGHGRGVRSYVDERARAHEDTSSSNRCRKDQF